ncbi:anti-repressor SinI family protein [Virgibacillus indicus]|uniref:anti-repressor SinI family protein n=1 Tax=Virgibacillus indicus TaxID=2024554 RepID=UPI000D529E44|nr:anti-repressor SinI family protein [Virgibacillus indicus]
MDNKALVKSPTYYYDKEWVNLISEAKELGLSKEKVRTYLKQGYPKMEFENSPPQLKS